MQLNIKKVLTKYDEKTLQRMHGLVLLSTRYLFKYNPPFRRVHYHPTFTSLKVKRKYMHHTITNCTRLLFVSGGEKQNKCNF